MTNINPTRFKGYRAEQNVDGTWNIFDVPIYAANVRSFGLIPVLDKATGEVRPEELILRHDAAWMEKAIETARLDYEERGYEAPLNINHNGRDEQVMEVGTIMPRYVKKTLYEGVMLDTLFADLRSVPEAIYQQIKAKRLRYRSVECPPSMDARPEIKALALLPHQPPYFKLQPLTIDTDAVPGNASAKVASYKTGKSVFALFDANYEGGGKVVDDADDKEPKGGSHSKSGGMGAMSDVTDDPNDNTNGKSRGNADAASNKDATDTTARADKNANADDDDTDGDLTDPKNLKSKGGFMDKLMALLTAIAGKMGIGPDDTQGAMPKGPAEQARGDETRDPLAMNYAAPKAVKAVATLPTASFDPAEFMAIKAKMALYDARFESIDKQGTIKKQVDAAVTELKGYNLTDKMVADMNEAAALGEKPLAMYVSTIKTLGVKDPPKDPMGMLLAKAGRESYPAEVMAYQAQGEEALARAGEEWATYKALGERVAHVKLADFLKVNVAAKSGGNFFGA